MLADLHERLHRVQWADEVPGAGWQYGTDLSSMQELAAYWRDRYDWRTQEAQVNRFQQYIVPLGGRALHVIHEPGRGPSPLPLLLSHGWPGAIVEFQQLIPLLTDPVRFGGDPADAFTVVAPSLPGYAFSFRANQPRLNIVAIADLFAALMTDVLGYRRFAAHGDDWGAFHGLRRPDAGWRAGRVSPPALLLFRGRGSWLPYAMYGADRSFAIEPQCARTVTLPSKLLTQHCLTAVEPTEYAVEPTEYLEELVAAHSGAYRENKAHFSLRVTSRLLGRRAVAERQHPRAPRQERGLLAHLR